MDTFVTVREAKKIEQFLLDGGEVIDYSGCRGLEHDAFLLLMSAFVQYEMNHNKKVKEKGKDKKLTKQFKRFKNENEYSE